MNPQPPTHDSDRPDAPEPDAPEPAAPHRADTRRVDTRLLVLALFPLLGVFAAAALLVGGGGGGGAARVPPTPPEATEIVLPTPRALAETPIFDFELTRLDGGTARLSDYAGQVVFLNFWATWCEPCTRELPAFQQFTREQITREQFTREQIASATDAAGDGPAVTDADDGPARPRAVVLAVNVQESADDVRAFLVQQGISDLTVLLDTDAAAADQYGVFNIPVTFVIDETGLIRYPKYGEITLDELYAYMDAVSVGAPDAGEGQG
jgi:peroxiredoxin